MLKVLCVIYRKKLDLSVIDFIYIIINPQICINEFVRDNAVTKLKRLLEKNEVTTSQIMDIRQVMNIRAHFTMRQYVVSVLHMMDQLL